MIRLFFRDILPFSVFILLLAGSWFYDQGGFRQNLVVYILLLIMYARLQRVEFSLSEELRDASLIRSDNRVAYGLVKITIACAIVGAMYMNQEREWVALDRYLSPERVTVRGESEQEDPDQDRAGGVDLDAEERGGVSEPANTSAESDEDPTVVPEAPGVAAREEHNTEEMGKEVPAEERAVASGSVVRKTIDSAATTTGTEDGDRGEQPPEEREAPRAEIGPIRSEFE